MRSLLMLLLLPALAACGKDEGKFDAVPHSAAAAVSVHAVPVREAALHPRLTAQAQVTSRNISKLAAQISARIAALPVEAGQRVARGAAVARLDCRDYQIALKQAQAGLGVAEARLKLAVSQMKRSDELASQGFISGDALEQRRTELNIAQADRELAASQVASAQSGVGKCVITAPFPAIVEAVPGNVGELAIPGTPLVILWDEQSLEVSAQVQAKDAGSLAQARSIAFHTPDGVYALNLKRVSPALSGASRTQEARLAFADKAAKPGATGQIQWQNATPHIPADLLVTRDGRLGVFVLEGGRANFKPIEGAQEGRPAPIDAAEDMVLITEGRFALQHGQPVKIQAPAAE
ncbi:MAG: efflux RND transporter periplasmic adaptor subunit [Pseudomonadota bacterium]